MNTHIPRLTALLELANHYPSPHNGQPIELQQIDGEHFTAFFRKERGLQAAEVSFLFSYVTMGVFLEHFSACARALGHSLTYELQLPPVATIGGEGRESFAVCTLDWDVAEPDNGLLHTLRFRQTSRKKYFEGIDEHLSDATITAASQKGMRLVKMNRADTHQAIWLNQRAVFDDMFDDAVRHELNHWLRYSQAEKEQKKDGLAYDCMEINGRAMRFIVRHYKILRMPGVSGLLKRYYLRTMSDKSDVFYLQAPFSTEQQAFDVGVGVIQIWLMIAESGGYLHPFGTIMSNLAAHQDFLKLAHITHEDIAKDYLIFIYRAGLSEPPTASLRIPISDHLFRGANV